MGEGTCKWRFGSSLVSCRVFYLLSLYFVKLINWQINWLIDWLKMFDVGDLPVLTFGNCVLKAGVIKWPVKLYVLFALFTLFFFNIQKHDLLRFFELLHTFSQTLGWVRVTRSLIAEWQVIMSLLSCSCDDTAWLMRVTCDHRHHEYSCCLCVWHAHTLTITDTYTGRVNDNYWTKTHQEMR